MLKVGYFGVDRLKTLGPFFFAFMMLDASKVDNWWLTIQIYKVCHVFCVDNNDPLFETINDSHSLGGFKDFNTYLWNSIWLDLLWITFCQTLIVGMVCLTLVIYILRIYIFTYLANIFIENSYLSLFKWDEH